jgi:hypothetical protein
MIIKCKCGKEVVEGEIVIRENKRGNKHKSFNIFEKPKGTILKNKSKNLEDWAGVCSDCQKKAEENKEEQMP